MAASSAANKQFFSKRRSGPLVRLNASNVGKTYDYDVSRLHALVIDVGSCRFRGVEHNGIALAASRSIIGLRMEVRHDAVSARHSTRRTGMLLLFSPHLTSQRLGISALPS